MKNDLLIWLFSIGLGVGAYAWAEASFSVCLLLGFLVTVSFTLATRLSDSLEKRDIKIEALEEEISELREKIDRRS